MDKMEKEDQELKNLVDKVVNGFNIVVRQENDLSNILLKGHLFIENFIEEFIASLNLNEGTSVHRLTFYEKLKKIKLYADQNKGYISEEIKKIYPVLSAINQVRNDLAHDYTFSLSEASIDKIGINLGGEYILNKYSKGRQNTKDNLLYCLSEAISELGRLMYHRICDLRRQKTANTNPNLRKEEK